MPFFIFFKKISMHDICMESHVIALPGCYLISTVNKSELIGILYWLCQCPLGLLPHFYDMMTLCYENFGRYQCPHGLMPHFYVQVLRWSVSQDGSRVNALSDLCLISTELGNFSPRLKRGVNALTGLYLISTTVISSISRSHRYVSMPSRASTSFLLWRTYLENPWVFLCQCPLGLVPHFYIAVY